MLPLELKKKKLNSKTLLFWKMDLNSHQIGSRLSATLY